MMQKKPEASESSGQSLPLVSAVITTHNRLPLLKLAVESVLAQTYSNIELIVVDDGSDDGTRAFCEGQSFRYIFIPKEESGGGNHARNVGVRAARGKYVAFLDDDDTWMLEKTAKQVALLEQTGCEIVHCGWRMMWIEGEQVTYIDQIPPAVYEGDLSRKILLRYHYPVTSEIMVRRQVLLDIGLYDEQLKASQEYDLMIRLAQRGPIYFVHEPLIVYRHDTNDTSRCAFKFQNWLDSVHYILRKHADLYARLSAKERRIERRQRFLEIDGRACAAHLTGFRWRLHHMAASTMRFFPRAFGYVRRHWLNEE